MEWQIESDKEGRVPMLWTVENLGQGEMEE
jgi:hypothetical protein